MAIYCHKNLKVSLFFNEMKTGSQKALAILNYQDVSDQE